MKRALKYVHNHPLKKLSLALVLSVGTFFASPYIAYAGWWDGLTKDAFVGALMAAADAILGGLFQFVAWLASWITSWATFFAAQFLDRAIEFSINGASFQIPGIEIGWTVFRDLVNMVFIFIILYVAIMTILQLTNFNTRQVLAKLVIVALLLNFSFFITGFVIDVGNATAQILYTAVTPGGSDIGATLTKNLNVSLLLDETNATDPSHFQKGVVHLMNTLLFLVSAFVFFAGAFLFIVRYIVLLFVLMFSPLAFAAIILPSTQRLWSAWLHKLIDNTFVAPMYLLTISVVIVIANSPDLMNLAATARPFVTSGANTEAAIPAIGTPGIFINYIIIIGLMVGALTVAKSIAGSTATTATKWAGATLGLAAGGAGFLGRRTAGRISRSVRDSDWLKEQAAKGGIGGYAARATMRTADVGARGSWDMRGGAMGKAIGGTVGAALGAGDIKVSTGRAGGQGGYERVREGQIKAREDLAKQLSKTSVSAEERKRIANAGAEEARKKKQELKASRQEMRSRQEQARIMLQNTTLPDEDRVRWQEQYDTSTQKLEAARKREGEIVAAQKEAQKKESERVYGYKDEKSRKWVPGTTETRAGIRRDTYVSGLQKRTVGSTVTAQTAANREAAQKIRGEKTKKQKMRELAQGLAKEEGIELEEKGVAPEPTAPTPPTSEAGGEQQST